MVPCRPEDAEGVQRLLRLERLLSVYGMKRGPVASQQYSVREDSDTVLMRKMYPMLRRFAAVVAPSDVEPDDLLQEALVRTLRVHRLSELDHPKAYLWQVMGSIASDHRRSASRRRDALARLDRNTPYEDSYPSDIAELEMLKPRERAVLYLHDIEGLPYKDIASVFGGRESSMRSTATRARQSLRGFLVKEEGLDANA